MALSGILLAAGAAKRFGGGKLLHALGDGTPLGVAAARNLAHAVAARRDADGWVIALADMPSIRPATISAVAEAVSKGAVLAAPVLNGKRGHPVGIAARFRDDLLSLTGDAGARDIVAAHKAELQLIASDDAGCLLHIDRPEDVPRGA